MPLQLFRSVQRARQNTENGEVDGSQTDAEGAPEAEAVADAGEEKSLHKFSLKLEDMTSGVLLGSFEGGRTSSRRRLWAPAQQARAPLQKTYSQYNLTQLGSGVVDETPHATLHGVYGLLARHVEVSHSMWEELQPSTQKAAAGQAGKGTDRDRDAAAASQQDTRRPRRSLFGLPLLHPYSPLALVWRCAMLLFDLSFTAFWVPLNVGFCFRSYGDLAMACTRSDLVGGIVYVANWLMGFQMGLVAASGSRRLVVMDGVSVAKVYVSSKFLMDTLAAVPFFVLVAAIASPHDGHVSPGRRLWSLLALLRLVRLLRLFNTVKVVYKDSINGQYRSSWVARRISVPLMYLIILGYQFLVVVNLCASLMVLLATYYGEVQRTASWWDGLKWIDWDAALESPPLMWYHAVYWCLTVLTTTGQGQAPRQLGDQIVSNFCSVYGMVFSGLVVGVVGEALMRATGDASAVLRSRRSVARASEWAEMRHLLPNLTRELQSFFVERDLAHRDTNLANRDFNREASYIEELPTSLRREVLRCIVEPQLINIPFLARLDPELRGMLASLFRPLDVPANHDLCRQGTTADRLWLVEWGTVVAKRYKEADAHPTTGTVCLLGETVLLRGVMEAAAVRPWTFRTNHNCRLWELHWDDLERLLNVEPRLVGYLLKYVRDRLIHKLDRAAERDYSWCELVAVLSRTLNQPDMLDAAPDNLKALVQARVDDGSLLSLLASWLEAGIATSLELGLGLGAGEGRKRDLASMSPSRLFTDGERGAGAPLNDYGATFHYSLAAPSPAIMSRYGSAGRSSATGAAAAAASILNRMSASNARGPLSGGGGGGGGGPASPRRIVPSAAPALLLHPSGGGGGGDAGSASLRPARHTEDLPPGELLSADGSDSGGGGGGTEPGGRAAAPRPIAKRSRSFTHGSNKPDGSAQSQSQPQPQVLLHPVLSGPGGGGRATQVRSRFAAEGGPLARRDPWVEAVADAAAAANVRNRRASRRASLSEDGAASGSGHSSSGGGGAAAAACVGGRSESGVATTEVAAAADGDADACADVDGEVAPCLLSVIAHTPSAYAIVDAGGVPAVAAPHSSGPHSVSAPQLPTAQSLPTPPPSAAPAAAAASAAAAAAVSDGGFPGHPPSQHQLQATGTAAASAASTSRFVRSASSGGGGGGGISHGGFLFSSPRLGSAGGGDGAVGTIGGGGGGISSGSPYHAIAAAVRPAAPAMIRTRSSHVLPLVPEESAIRSSIDGGGGGAAAAAARHALAATATVAGGSTLVPPIAPDGRVSAPPAGSALHSLRRGSTVHGLISGGGGAAAAAGPAAAAVAAALVRRPRGVSRSRSALHLGQRPSLPLAVAAAPSLPRVREEGTASGSGVEPDSRCLGDDSGGATAAFTARSRSPSDGDLQRRLQQQHQHQLGGMPNLELDLRADSSPAAAAASQSDSPFASAAVSAAAASSDGPPPPPPPPRHHPQQLLPLPSFAAAAFHGRISGVAPEPAPPPATSPAAAAAAAATAACLVMGGEISGAPVSDGLISLPLPDRVSKLRVRTSAPVARSLTQLPGGAGDVAPWPLSPVVAAAGAAPASSSAGGSGGGGACPAPALCVTCGRCTCAACRARALAAAAAVEQGVAAVTAAGPRVPYNPGRPAAAAAAAASAASEARLVPRPPHEMVRAAGGIAATAAAGSAAGSAAAAVPWTRGGGGGAGGRGPETWRRRRVSMVLDLSMPSVPLPY
ncbi:hypothetical protein PLESTB_001131200 [Pleodorina starrii]|uniref:Cyclic nucleotide-binding domain-containing protein n=1 Tax=Pleodorina starrii TaxID=330485 RepID=A0A9W6F502_9CHLO|nr:hypothetical protein PLESTM_001368600 [Pleodorina starrii]GLC56652.1 hypothetical protein PLESTB_001131200 [Pleodorina starrii]GLC69039.1 hypothetical protein PLESTF_000773100 [Pleodorina starrii]